VGRYLIYFFSAARSNAVCIHHSQNSHTPQEQTISSPRAREPLEVTSEVRLSSSSQSLNWEVLRSQDILIGDRNELQSGVAGSVKLLKPNPGTAAIDKVEEENDLG
jgi:hypothetical protein